MFYIFKFTSPSLTIRLTEGKFETKHSKNTHANTYTLSQVNLHYIYITYAQQSRNITFSRVRKCNVQALRCIGRSKVFTYQHIAILRVKERQLASKNALLSRWFKAPNEIREKSKLQHLSNFSFSRDSHRGRFYFQHFYEMSPCCANTIGVKSHQAGAIHLTKRLNVNKLIVIQVFC